MKSHEKGNKEEEKNEKFMNKIIYGKERDWTNISGKLCCSIIFNGMNWAICARSASWSIVGIIQRKPSNSTFNLNPNIT